MDLAVMCECLDVQIVRMVDVLANLEHHRQRLRGPQVGADHFGQVLADVFGDFAGVLVPMRVILRLRTICFII